MYFNSSEKQNPDARGENNILTFRMKIHENINRKFKVHLFCRPLEEFWANPTVYVQKKPLSNVLARPSESDPHPKKGGQQRPDQCFGE